MTPLSEHEKRQLRLLESQLRADDPKFAKTMRTTRSVSPWHRPGARNIILAAAGFLVGIPTLIVGLIVPGAVAVSIAGLAVFMFGVYFAVAAVAFSAGVTPAPFMTSFEAKWDERKRNGL